MTDSKLRQLITEAVLLDRQITADAARLSTMKSLLALEAESRAADASPTDGGGTSLTLEGADGCVARITTAGRTLKASIKAEGKDFAKIKEAAQTHLNRLFEASVSYKLIAGFREEAAALLGARDGAKLIKLCENSGKTSVSFETKETAA